MFSEMFPPRCRQPQYWAKQVRAGMTIKLKKKNLILIISFTFKIYFLVIFADFSQPIIFSGLMCFGLEGDGGS